MRLRFKGRRSFRGRSPTSWLGANVQVNGLAVNTISSVSLADTNAAYAASPIDVTSRRATVLRTHLQLFAENTAGTGIALVDWGVVVIPYTSGGVIDASDFSPQASLNMNKPWLKRGTFALMANNANTNQEHTAMLEIDLKSKRILRDASLCFVMAWAQRVATPVFNYVLYSRVLVGRTA